MYLFMIFFFFFNMVFGMLSDPTHTHKDYAEIAKNHPYARSVCRIHNSKGSMTGVLIAPNVVATAAHGLTGMEGNSASDLKLSFFEGPTVMGETFVIDPGYLERCAGEEAKFDKAFIKLASPVPGVTPVPFLRNLTISEQSLLTVLTFGQGDCPLTPPPVFRGFHLFETEVYYAAPLDPDTLHPFRSILLSSLFFDPKNLTEKERTQEAIKRWKASGKKPYALALPGTSGAPVFINIDGKEFLFGIVTSYGSTDDRKFLELPFKEQALGKTHTIFAIFYQRTEDTYSLDPFISKISKS